ncbi:hypothetical protein AB7M39_006025 [Bradyrhizobium diazoefficiens]
MVEVQVEPCSRATRQNRLAEKARLNHAGRPDPKRRQHGVGQRVGVKQRQIGLVHVAGVQVLMRGVDLGAPQRVGVGPQHRLRPRCRAGGVLYAARRERIGHAPGTVGAVGEQRPEAVVVRDGLCRRRARIVRGHRDPAQIAAVLCKDLGVGRLRDGGNRAAMIRKIFHLGRRRTRVCGHCDGAQLDAGKPGQQRLDAIVQVNEHIFARPDAALRQPRRERADPLVKLAIAPVPRRRVERRPDQEGMSAAHLGAHLQEPRHIQPVKRAHDSGCGLLIGHASSRAACILMAAAF